MSEPRYQFRIEDDQDGCGDMVYVDFETMMNAKDGFLVLPDGRTAKRVNRPSKKRLIRDAKDAVAKITGCKAGPKIVSDALGFTDNQLAKMEHDRVAHGFHGVEFLPDPTEPRFYQVHCSSERVKAEYMDFRGFKDQNSKNGSAAMIDAGQLESAKRMVLERFGSQA